MFKGYPVFSSPIHFHCMEKRVKAIHTGLEHQYFDEPFLNLVNLFLLGNAREHVTPLNDREQRHSVEGKKWMRKKIRCSASCSTHP